MRRNSLTIAVFLLALGAFSTSRAQLGPKDKAGLEPTDLDRIQVGNRAPDFTLEDTDGRRVSLSDFQGKKTVILVFYRGYW